jgi:hypothetical protein
MLGPQRIEVQANTQNLLAPRHRLDEIARSPQEVQIGLLVPRMPVHQGALLIGDLMAKFVRTVGNDDEQPRRLPIAVDLQGRRSVTQRVHRRLERCEVIRSFRRLQVGPLHDDLSPGDVRQVQHIVRRPDGVQPSMRRRFSCVQAACPKRRDGCDAHNGIPQNGSHGFSPPRSDHRRNVLRLQ